MRAVGPPDQPFKIAAAAPERPDFSRLYEESFERIYAFIARQIPTRQETEDLTAEVFHQAFASLDQFHWRGRPLIAWLYGIARNVLASYWRRLGRANALVSDDLDPTTDEEIERQALLTELVQSLSPHQRTVIQRRFIDRMTIREIAEELGRSQGAVKQLQLRALENLRRKLGGSK